MKKGLMALLTLALVLGATSAMAVTLDLPLAEAWALNDAADFQFHPLNASNVPNTSAPMYGTYFPDLDQNGITEVAELALLQTILANDTIPGQAAIIAAFNTNLAATAPLQSAFISAGEDPAEVQQTAMLLVCVYLLGGQAKADFLKAYLYDAAGDAGALAVAIWNGCVPNMVEDTWPTFDPASDLDGDGITNVEEFEAAGGDPVAYVYQVMTPGEITLSATVGGGGLLEVGGSMTLTATAAGGTAPYTYQWSKDGLPLSGQTAATLVLSGVLTDNVDDSGIYSVRVTDDVGAITSAEIEITVLPEGSLPVAGFAALGLLVTLCAGVGARKAMK